VYTSTHHVHGRRERVKPCEAEAEATSSSHPSRVSQPSHVSRVLGRSSRRPKKEMLRGSITRLAYVHGETLVLTARLGSLTTGSGVASSGRGREKEGH
jgi:hypothetical protein